MLAKSLVNEGDSVRAKEALDYSLKVLPAYNVPYDYYSTSDLAESYNRIGEKEKAAELYKELAELSLRNLNWYNRLNDKQYAGLLDEIGNNFVYLERILPFFDEYDKKLFEQYASEYGQYYQRFNQFAQRLQGSQKGGANR
jgi:hypothetical protein